MEGITNSRGVTAADRVTEVRLDRLTPIQTRSRLSESAIKNFAEMLAEGEPIDPSVVYLDAKHNKVWLAAGHHRMAAYRMQGKDRMPCIMRAGSRWDAMKFGILDNRQHVGVLLSRADKIHAIKLVLQARHKLSDNAIGTMCGVHHSTVAKYRQQMEDHLLISKSDTRVGADGVNRRNPKRETDLQSLTDPPLLADLAVADGELDEQAESAVSQVDGDAAKATLPFAPDDRPPVDPIQMSETESRSTPVAVGPNTEVEFAPRPLEAEIGKSADIEAVEMTEEVVAEHPESRHGGALRRLFELITYVESRGREIGFSPGHLNILAILDQLVILIRNLEKESPECEWEKREPGPGKRYQPT